MPNPAASTRRFSKIPIDHSQMTKPVSNRPPPASIMICKLRGSSTRSIQGRPAFAASHAVWRASGSGNSSVRLSNGNAPSFVNQSGSNIGRGWGSGERSSCGRDISVAPDWWTAGF
ncbi:MAG: hypothetical protein EA381_07625 [Planctomycetaceae bacterium]|nr:MAG: hypothetical protein EA381_07625 [Planctomycetaceae bacterium]